MMRFAILFVIVGLALLGFGGQKAATALANTSPTRMSYVDYCRQRPSAAWLDLSDAWVDYGLSSQINTIDEKSKRTTDVSYYAPVFQSEEDGARVVAYLKCNNTESVALCKESFTYAYDDDKFLKWYEQNYKRMYVKRTVKGLKQWGLESSSEVRKLLSERVEGNLDANFVIIDEDKQPDGGLGFLMLIGGVLSLGGSGVLFYMASKETKQPQQTMQQGRGPGMAPPMGARRRGQTRRLGPPLPGAPVVAPPPPMLGGPQVAPPPPQYPPPAPGPRRPAPQQYAPPPEDAAPPAPRMPNKRRRFPGMR